MKRFNENNLYLAVFINSHDRPQAYESHSSVERLSVNRRVLIFSGIKTSGIAVQKAI